MAISSPPAGIFKAYDIRGIYGEELDAETAADLTAETFEKAFRSWRRFNPRRGSPRRRSSAPAPPA